MRGPRFGSHDGLRLGPLPGTRYPDPRIEALDPRFPRQGLEFRFSHENAGAILGHSTPRERRGAAE